MRIRDRWLLPFIPLLIATAAMEAAVGMGWVASYLVPAPSSVWQALWKDSATIWEGFFSTAMHSLLAFSLSCVAGMLLGGVFASSRWTERVFYPYAVFFQTVPIISIAPLLVIWFGYGSGTTIASAFIASVFPVIASTIVGLRSTEPAYRDLFHLYGAAPVQTLWKLRIPFALPHLFTGLRIASGLAVIGTIVGEFIGGGGLGGIVDEARVQQRVDRVFAAVVLASFLGFAYYLAIGAASRRALRHWHSSEK